MAHEHDSNNTATTPTPIVKQVMNANSNSIKLLEPHMPDDSDDDDSSESSEEEE